MTWQPYSDDEANDGSFTVVYFLFVRVPVEFFWALHMYSK